MTQPEERLPIPTRFLPNQPRLAGLGDLVAIVAQPIARVVDRVAGTDLVHCPGCARNRKRLNRAVPFRPFRPS